MQKNDIIEIDITDISSDGNGIGRVNSMVIFIPNVAIGDRVEARILKVKKTYAYAKVEKIIKLSEDRIENNCPVYQKCGGCCFRHISYDAELKIKQKTVYDCINRIAKIDDKYLQKIFKPIIKADSIECYRNKVQLPVGTLANGEIVSGFFSLHSHRLIPITDCDLQPDIFYKINKDIISWANENRISAYDEKRHRGYLRHIYLREAKSTGEIMVCLVVNSKSTIAKDSLIKLLKEKYSKVKSIVYNFNDKKTNVVLGEKCQVVWGQKYITDILCGLRFNISPLSFYQVNHDQTEKLYNQVNLLANPDKNDNILDLFCGIGTIGLTLAKSCNKLLGIEIIPSAVKNAIGNAKINGIDNAEFICSDAGNISEFLNKKSFLPDIVLIDPPRKGCSALLIEELIKILPKKIVYVSCNPATLARDLEVLKGAYNIENIVPVDMFPRTKHVETVVLLSGEKVDGHIDIDLDVEKLEGKSGTATYAEIKEYVAEHNDGMKVTNLYIGQIKDKMGLEKRQNYNVGSGEGKVPTCPQDKEKAIVEAFKHFNLI